MAETGFPDGSWPRGQRYRRVHSTFVCIPLTDVRAQYAALGAEVRARITEVVDSGHFILGPNVRAFEEEAARYLGVEAAVGVANGTDALILALESLQVGPGDEVICPAFTFYATAEAIARVGATPVFCDIDPKTLNLDPADATRRVTPETKAIVAVHLFGRPAPLDALPIEIPVIEDAAQAFGAGGAHSRAGSCGVAATFSFFPTKNLFCFGDGGLVVTNDLELAARVRVLRFHGSTDKETFSLIGHNSRLDEIQAAVLRTFLAHVDGWNALRQEAALRYQELGLGQVCELPSPDSGHVYHLYVVRSPERDRLLESFASAGVGARAYYRTPLHLQPAFAHLGYTEGSLPETERAARENVAVPMWAGIGRLDQEKVVAAARGGVVVGASQ